MKLACVLAVLVLLCNASSYADTFGSGANSFDIEFVAIGNPDNPADSDDGSALQAGIQHFGSVPYSFRIGKFEISEQMIDKANAAGSLGLARDNRGPDKPATSLSWSDQARFINWLNSSQGHKPAYKFDTNGRFQPWTSSDEGYDSKNRYRNKLCRYYLPTVDEWYKAAFYNPSSGAYNDYPTGSNTIPDGIDFAGDPQFDAVFDDGGYNLLPNDISDVGLSSPYGTAGQGGNVWEREETDFDLSNDSTAPRQGIRGGGYFHKSIALHAGLRVSGEDDLPISVRDNQIGFRVASIAVPEPTAAILSLLALGPASIRRRCQ